MCVGAASRHSVQRLSLFPGPYRSVPWRVGVGLCWPLKTPARSHRHQGRRSPWCSVDSDGDQVAITFFVLKLIAIANLVEPSIECGLSLSLQERFARAGDHLILLAHDLLLVKHQSTLSRRCGVGPVAKANLLGITPSTQPVRLVPASGVDTVAIGRTLRDLHSWLSLTSDSTRRLCVLRPCRLPLTLQGFSPPLMPLVALVRVPVLCRPLRAWLLPSCTRWAVCRCCYWVV